MKWAVLPLAVVSVVAHAQTSVTTQHNDIGRTGANVNETILTPLNVNTRTFGKLFSLSVDGWVYAQPLYMPAVTVGPGTAQPNTKHAVVFVATEHDSIFAFDADSNLGANANPLWQASLIDAAHGGSEGESVVPNDDLAQPDIIPEIGITSTPAIDPSSNTIYVVAKSSLAGARFIQRLHALDITTGQEKFGGPIELSGAVGGAGNGSYGQILNWDPKWENNRAGLLLLNGIVYIGFGAHYDLGPWHGWVLAYNARSLKQTGAWCTTPNGTGGGIWMGGTGLAADVPQGKPYGRIFAATGNGTFDAAGPGYTNAMDYGDSIIRLDLADGAPTMVSAGISVGDAFTPHNADFLDEADLDPASGGVVVIPDSAGSRSHQLVQVGKSGIVYTLNREELGGHHVNTASDVGESAYVHGLWGAPAYWNGHLYVWSSNDHLMSFDVANRTLTTSSPSSTSPETAGWPSPTPSISANGTTGGIVWSIRADNADAAGRAILYAHDASNVATLLYSSESNVARDNPGNSVKFVVPTVVNGKVYVGTESQLSVYGLLERATQAAAPAITPDAQSFSSAVQVTIAEATPGATIFYTTDGTLPTTASEQYSTPFSITTTMTINAIAAGDGLLASNVASVTYTMTSQVAAPTFYPIPGAYNTTQWVNIRTTTPNCTIYYTLDGTTPTSNSNRYTGPVFLGATATLSALAIDNNSNSLRSSPLANGLYILVLPGVDRIDLSAGFAPDSMFLLGSARLDGTALELTDGRSGEAGAGWYQIPVLVQSFTTDFTFQIKPASAWSADGLTFAIQANGLMSIGPSGGGLGYGPDTPVGKPGIEKSLAIKFDLWDNAGEGDNSTGLYINGASPTVPRLDMTGSGISLHSGDVFRVHAVYDGGTLSMTVTDAVTEATFKASWSVNIPAILGGNVAYIGFTAGTGTLSSKQEILSWTFSSSDGSLSGNPN